jgi:hypothetical protein
MTEEDKKYSLDGVVRLDEYNISVDGFTLRATPEQEAKLRTMNKEQRYNFLKIMGK